MEICLESCMGRISSSSTIQEWLKNTKYDPRSILFSIGSYPSARHHVHGECIRMLGLNQAWICRCNHRLLLSNHLTIISRYGVIWDFGRNLRGQVVDLKLITQAERSLNTLVSTAAYCNPIVLITQHWYPVRLGHWWKCRTIYLSTTHMILTLLIPTLFLWPEEDILQRFAHIGVCSQPPRHSSAICFHFPNRFHFHRIHPQRVTPTSHVSPFLKLGRCSQSY